MFILYEIEMYFQKMQSQNHAKYGKIPNWIDIREL